MHKPNITILDGYVSPTIFVINVKLDNRPDYVQVEVSVNQENESFKARILQDYTICTEEEKTDILNVVCEAIKKGELLLPDFIPLSEGDEEYTHVIDENWESSIY